MASWFWRALSAWSGAATGRIRGSRRDARCGRLLELFQQWTPDAATQQRILVANPARLYGVPN